MAQNLPDTLTPDQMTSLQGGGQAPAQAPAQLPDTITPEQMNAIQGPAPAVGNGPAPNFAGSIGRFLANSANAIEQPFVSIAATPVQLLAKAIGAPDPFADGFPQFPGSTNGPMQVAPLTGAGLIQKAGSLAQIGTMVLTPEAAGITGIAKLAALGAVGGGAASVGAGQLHSWGDLNPFGDSDTAHAIRVGALFGGILGGLGNAARIVSATEKGATGVTPAMENELSQTRPSTLSKYIDTAKTSAKDFHAPTVDDMVTQDITKGATILEKKVLPKATKAIEQAKQEAGPAPIIYAEGEANPAGGANGVQMLRDDINTAMQRMTGHQFSSYGDAAETTGLRIDNYKGAPTTGLNGDEFAVEQLPGRVVDVSPAEQKTLEYVGKQLQILEDNPTVQVASDVLRNLDGKIGDWSKPAESAVGSFVRYARGAVNRVIAPAAPKLAAANHAYGDLMDIQNAVTGAAGKDLKNIDLLARRTLYAGQSGKAQSVLDGLYDAVKGHLPPGEESYTTKAIVGRFAKDTFGGETAKTGFAQGMSAGDVAGTASGYTSRVVGAALRAGKRALSPNPEQYAMSISKGEPYSFVPMVHQIDEFLDSPTAKPWLNSFKAGLKQMGVSSNNVGTAAKDALRMMMFNNLSNSAASTPQAPGSRQLSQ